MICKFKVLNEIDIRDFFDFVFCNIIYKWMYKFIKLEFKFILVYLKWGIKLNMYILDKDIL